MPKSNLRNNLMREMIAPQSSLDNNPKAKIIPLDRLVSNPFQVRQDFDSEEARQALQELSENIARHGILQPLIVRPSKDEVGKFEIVAGERRYRAAGLAGLSEVPVMVESYEDAEAQLVTLTENLQRRDLNFVEEVNFLSQLNRQRSIDGKGGESDLAELIHKSRTYVAKRLKLANHPDLVKQVTDGLLSINEAYEAAVQRDNTVTDSEKDNKVFPGNVLSQLKIGRDFKVRLVPFTRLREAVIRLTDKVDKLGEDERSSLKAEISELEKELGKLRGKL